MKYNRNLLLRIIALISFLCSIGVFVFDKNKTFGFIFLAYSCIFFQITFKKKLIKFERLKIIL